MEIQRGSAQPMATLPVIMHVITDLDSGGAQHMLLRLVTASRKFRHVVVSLADAGRLATALRSAGAEVFTLRMSRTLPSPGAIFRLAHLIRRERPVVLQTWLYHADLVGLLAASLIRFRPIAWNLRCSNMDFSRYRWSTRAIVKLLVRLSPMPDIVMVNSEAGRRWHYELGYRPRCWELVPNGIDTTAFRPSPEWRAQWRSRLDVKESDILVGMSARRDPMKDHEGMLLAAAAVARRQPRLVFVLAGYGVSRTDPILTRLADEVDAPVHLIDECDDLPGLNAALDIGVLSSAFGEGFPNVVAETMAAGVPCVVTDVGDSASIIGDTGRVVRPRDTQALADAIATLAADDTMRAELGRAARRRIVEFYDLQATVKRYEMIWQCLVDRGAALAAD